MAEPTKRGRLPASEADPKVRYGLSGWQSAVCRMASRHNHKIL